MAESYKRLGAVAPADDREQLLYVSPAATQTLVSNITVTNRSSSSASFDINVYESGVTQQSDLADYPSAYFVAPVQTGSYAFYSTNGVVWTFSTIDETVIHYQGYAVTYGNEKFVAIPRMDSSATTYSLSSDGLNWTLSTLPASYQYWDIIFGDNKFFLVHGNSLTSYFTTDNINWTATTLPYGGNSGAYGGGTFITTPSYSSTILSSTDLVTWTQATLPYTNYARNATYGNGIFLIAGGGPYSNSTDAAYSTDGITWTQTTMPQSQRWNNTLVYGDGKFIAAAYGSSIIAISTDAITWTNATLPLSRRWREAGYGSGTFVILTQQYNEVVYSTDGITWSTSTVPGSRTPLSMAVADVVVQYSSPKLNNLYKNMTIQANDVKVLEPGVVLGPQSSIIVKDNSGGDLTFSTYGVELS